LDKKDILKYADDNISSLKDIAITIGVWANKSDSIYMTPFSFNIRIENDNLYNIYKVNSDNKALCNSTKMEDKDMYRCLYIFENDYINEINNLIIYASAHDQSASINIYANYIEPIIYEMSEKELLKQYIPTKTNNKFSTNKEKNAYLYINDELPKNKYLLLSVEVNKQTTIELISSFGFLQKGAITPSPSSPQIFMFNDYMEYTLYFPSKYMVMVNPICIGGSTELYWNTDTTDTNEYYYLNEKNDRLSLASEKPETEHALIIKQNGIINELNKDIIFYV
jgi:hypothetical protein